MKKILSHPITRGTRRAIRTAMMTCAILLAVAFVTSLTVDLGPVLRAQAESAGSRFIERPMRIGRLSIHLFRGRFVVEDLVIEGLEPDARPFLVARRIDVSMPWSTLVNRRIVFDAIEMVDWRMFVEMRPDGQHNFPRFTRGGAPRGQSAWTTTLSYIRASRGEFTYEDYGTPWSTVARNLEVTVTRPTSEYRGQASFSDGTVRIQGYEPMRADMQTAFRIVDGQILLQRIDLDTDGARSVLTGEVDMNRWPEQTYHVQSRIDFPRMREIFFARDAFSLFGTGDFTGTFHLFKETIGDRTRTGRELTGTFRSAMAGVNAYRFGNLRGAVRWVPEFMEVTGAKATFFDGDAGFSFRMAPLGDPDVGATASFDAEYTNVDLRALTAFHELEGIRLDGRASGRNLIEWPLGDFSGHRGEGTMEVEPPPGVTLMTRSMPQESIDREARLGEVWGPFSNHTPTEPVAVGGHLAYRFDPEWLDLGPSRVATTETYIEFEGRTAYGEQSRLPFHVTSADWQESDRLLAGLMTAFGARTNAVEVGGHGTFDGVMLNSFTAPRIEGLFTGDAMKAWDVTWGAISGSAVIENGYVDVNDVTIAQAGGSMTVGGRFAAGYPRRDGGDEIDAIVQVERWPLADLRHAFQLDDYPVEGRLSGEYHLFGRYETPFGFGSMRIDEGRAYEEPFETASASLRFEGPGVRLDGIDIRKGAGGATGAAFVGWDGTYSFEIGASRLPVDSLSLLQTAGVPLSGVLDFTAGGSGTFDLPRYSVRGTLSDLFLGDEGVGQIVGELGIDGDLMTVRIEAASPRLAVSGTGRISLTPEMDAELSLSVSDTSLDPYLRAFEPRLSPYTTAVASGTVRVVGELANIEHLLVDATVDRLDLGLLDYRLRNEAPIRVALDQNIVRLLDVRLVGEDTELDLSGQVELDGQRLALRAEGSANLGILQGFVPDIRSSGRASLEATFDGTVAVPVVNGSMTVLDGRIRHFQLPHALEDIGGVVQFDSRGLALDGLSARLGGGAVQFGGRIDMEGYLPGRLDLSMTGQEMRLRFPEGMRSLVDASLTLEGPVEAPILGGEVNVRSAVYTRRFDAGIGVFDFSRDAVASGGAALESTLPLRYDLQINAPSTLRIENNTARIVSTADLQLRGTFDRPQVFGRAEIDRGEVTFEGRRYVVTRGTIDFNNPTRIEPFFDIETETRVRVPDRTYRVIVRAAGTPERLTPEFSSDPPLPEVDVLGLLFSDAAPGLDPEFRRYNTQLTPQQQLLRERASRALTSAFSSEVDRVVGQAFGVDTFQLTPSLVDPKAQSSRLDPAARLTIGKRLSDRIYVTYSRSLSSATRDQIILLEYDQTDRFSWILSRNEDRTYALDVRVRHVF
ncbi:MAG: hypothetical protein HOP14_02210 [Acidobacteria bacterium]|nr:hypothetical protein [Acidobacteriota bacterium]